MRFRPMLLATVIVSAASLPGCGLAHGGLTGSGFEGTWLLIFDLNYSEQGDCVDDCSENVVTTYSGEDYELVDFYDAGSGQFVVMLEDVLTGEAQGRSFQVGSTRTIWSSTEDKDIEVITMDGDLSGATLSGQVITTSQWMTGSSTRWFCEQTYSYTAQQVTSDRNLYLEN